MGVCCLIRKVDLAELTWASGFFDGEGSTYLHCRADRTGYLRLGVSVPQRGHGEIPLVLRRFQKAVLGMGRIDPPSNEGIYVWRAGGFEEAQATVALLWAQLGRAKRDQAHVAMHAVRAQYVGGRYDARRSRRPSNPHRRHGPALSAPLPSYLLDRSWAAGFLDAEGSFGLVASTPRKRGPVWCRIRASATQHGIVGTPPEVLVKLKRVLGIGRIERHGEPDDFKWLVEGAPAVEAVLGITSPWLGPRKVEQARRAVEAFAAQARLRGDAAHCLRGHRYDVEVIRAGRRRRFCNACGRITARQRRAARGIKPRQFKNIARRYTF